MKKLISVLLIALVLCSLFTGCAKDEPAAGGYSNEREVTAEDLAIFEQALGAKDALRYEPLRVSTQVVAGTNYRFYANDVLSAIADKHAYITIFVPLDENEKPTVVEIVDAE